MADDTDKYPSAKDAIFGDDTVANLRCGVKYMVWHTSYIGAAAVMGSLTIGVYAMVTAVRGAIQIAYKASRSEGVVRTGNRIADGIIEGQQRVEALYEAQGRFRKIVDGSFVALLLALVVAVIGVLGLLLTTVWDALVDGLFAIVSTLMPFFKLAGVTLLVFVVSYLFGSVMAWAYGGITGRNAKRDAKRTTASAGNRVASGTGKVGRRIERHTTPVVERASGRVKSSARRASRSAKERSHDIKDRGGAVSVAAQNTPGVRRVYGECPVSKSLTPRWYETFGERLETRFGIDDEDDEDSEEDTQQGYAMVEDSS